MDSPDEWNIRDAYIQDDKGKKILDFKKNFLSIVYHSVPVKKWISKKDLIKKLHYDETLPSAIPFVTTYYKKYWGFCMSKNNIKKLKRKKYFVILIQVLKRALRDWRIF